MFFWSVGTSFFKRPSKEWIGDDTSFINDKGKIKNMRVVNDSAERGVKLVNDFNKECLINEKKAKQPQTHVFLTFEHLYFVKS